MMSTVIPKTFAGILHGACYLGYSKWARRANNDNQMTVEKCKKLCFEDPGDPRVFAGLKNGNQCWCGDEIRSSQTYACSTPCSGDSSQKCGGIDRMNIYQSMLIPVYCKNFHYLT